MSSVVLSLAAWWALLGSSPVVEAALAPVVVRRDLTLRAVGAVVEVRGTVTLAGEGSARVPLRLGAGLERLVVRWQGRSLPVLRSSDGGLEVVVPFEGPGRLELQAEVTGSLANGVDLDLVPATWGTVVVDGVPSGMEAVLTTEGYAPRGPGGFATGAGHLSVGWRPVVPPQRAAILDAACHLGLVVDDGRVALNLDVDLLPRVGALPGFRVDLPGLGADAVVDAGDGRPWRREGDALVAPGGSEPGRVRVRWTVPMADPSEARVVVPPCGVAGVSRQTTAVVVARTGEIDVRPELRGLQPVPRAELDPRAEVEGQVVASYAGSGPGGGALQLVALTLVPAAPVRAESAYHDLVANGEGGWLVRSTWMVRNTSAPALHVALPEAAGLLVARVDGQISTLARDADGVAIPLRRSVRTVRGPIAYPVEVVWWVDGWTAPELPLPGVDAEVGVVRATVRLPDGVRVVGTSRGRVDAFGTEGLTLGLAADDPRYGMASTLLQRATQAWVDLDLGRAQSELDHLRAVGVEGEDVARLQANLDELKADGEDDVERAIKAEARSRADTQRRLQEDALETANAQAASGDLEGAARSYGTAIELGQTLIAFENEESVEIASKNAVAEARKAEVLEKKVAKDDMVHPTDKEVVDAPAEVAEFDGMVEAVVGGQAGGLMGYAAMGAGEVARDEVAEAPPIAMPKSESADRRERAPSAAPASRPGRGSSGASRAAGPPPPIVDTKAEGQVWTPPPLEPVTSATSDLIVSTTGEILRFESLLVPAGARPGWSVVLSSPWSVP